MRGFAVRSQNPAAGRSASAAFRDAGARDLPATLRRYSAPMENIVSRSCLENASNATIVCVRATPCIDEI
jgi:hypothetical protein